MLFATYSKAKNKYPDVDEWLATTIYDTFGEDAEAVIIGTVCEETTDPWEDPRVFEKVALAINDRKVFCDIKQEITMKEIAYAVKVLRKRYPEDQFNDSVTKWIAAEAAEEGMLIMPEELEFVQPFIPVIKLTKEQEQVQMAYLSEISDYVAIRETIDNVRLTGVEVKN